ncbi:MAG: 2-hydroxyacyl-CoA dehydratase [Planctomycetes bacterium]|nr:2-hydroxyacyl-CoA dehydratase [Planctomycetota bacterium]
MRLTTTFDIFAWYDQVRASGRPVAWCSAFAPAEVLVAMGIIPVYPENHAAMMGALSESRDPDHPYARAAITAAEGSGYRSPRLCSYALADLGALTGGRASPIGGLPPPDLFYACDSQCAVVARWGDEVQRHFHGLGAQARDIPHYVLKAPPLTRSEHHTPAELAGFEAQILAHVDDIGRRLGLTLDHAELARVVARSAEANRLWQRCLELARQRPAPWTNLDAFTAMAPIVIARGTQTAIDYYRDLLAELEARSTAGYAAVPAETVRLVWDAIPIWPRKNWLAKFCAERGAAFVASTYTHSWWFEFDATRPLATLVERYAWNTMNRSGAWVLDWTLGLVRDYAADGIVAHWNRSCGIWNSYVKRRVPGYQAAGVPHIVIEADMVDARAFDEAAVSRQLDDFITTLRARSAVRSP